MGSKVHATADLRTVLPTTTVKSYNRHLQTRSLGSATTMSTLTNSKPQKGPSASSAATAGWTAKRTKPQLFQSVWQDNGNPLKLYPFIDTSEVLALPNPLPQPDDVTQVDCGCPIVDMAWKNSVTEEMIDYDPNTLP